MIPISQNNMNDPTKKIEIPGINFAVSFESSSSAIRMTAVPHAI